MIRTFLLVLFGILSGGSPGPAADTSVLLVEHPESLILYNRYQQVLSPKDRGELLPFTPMQVIRSRDTLGDGITPCMSVEILGNPYYLLLDENGHPVGRSRAGSMTMYQGTRIPFDTVIVMRSGSLGFEAAGSRSRNFLRAGERLTRVFVSGTKTFALRLEPPLTYGWLALNPGEENRLWKIALAPGVTGPVISDRIRDSVRAKTARVNEVFSRLYSFLNRTSQHRRPVPQWTVETTDTSITCLLGATDSVDAFRESTRYFAKELESTTLGSGLGVFLSPGRIDIRPK